MRKAQIEIIGLLIIVIIISFMILFAVSVMVPKKDDGVDPYLSQSISSRFVGSLLKTDSTCAKNMPMGDLIIDCARSPETGGSLDLVCESGDRPCAYMSDVLDTLLANSFDSIQKPYEFKIISPDQQVIYRRNCSVGNECTTIKKSKGDSWNQPLPVPYKGTMSIRMCMPDCG